MFSPFLFLSLLYLLGERISAGLLVASAAAARFPSAGIESLSTIEIGSTIVTTGFGSASGGTPDTGFAIADVFSTGTVGTYKKRERENMNILPLFSFQTCFVLFLLPFSGTSSSALLCFSSLHFIPSLFSSLAHLPCLLFPSCFSPVLSFPLPSPTSFLFFLSPSLLTLLGGASGEGGLRGGDGAAGSCGCCFPPAELFLLGGCCSSRSYVTEVVKPNGR